MTRTPLGGGQQMLSHSHHTRVETEAGKVMTLQIGGKGRPVVGRVALPPEGMDGTWTFANNTIHTKLILPKPPIPDNVDPDHRAAWLKKWNETPEGKAFAERNRALSEARKTYPLIAQRDGTFRVEDVEAGTYHLTVSANEPPPAGQCCFGDTLGTLEHEFVVDAMPGGRSDEPLELPTLPLTLAPRLQVGDVAPTFAVKTLDGRGAEIKLSDYAGKYVLLSFWATTCGPCLRETANLKTISEMFGADDRLAIIGVNLDAKPDAARAYVIKNQLNWTQGHAGDWSHTDVPQSFGVRGIPAILLIGPDGKLIAKNLHGEQVRPALEQALAKK
jgi:peroxiredoxin